MTDGNGTPGASGRIPERLTGAGWLLDPALRRLFAALGEGNARIVGGAVRNALIGVPVQDVDIATRLPPEEVMRRARAAGFSVHPVGIDHGSVLVARGGRTYEVTTLRHDVETDGRHARVAFTDDWEADARRRDFTMNALYADARGNVYDPLGGLPDVRARRIRFIGDARERIREDFLRILRFFRFWAQYAREDPDPEALNAVSELREGLSRISRERIREEMRRLMVAPRAVEAMLHMAHTGVLDHVVPETCRRDFEALTRMATDDARTGLAPDWLLRLAAFCGPLPELKDAFRLSRREAARLETLRTVADLPSSIRGWHVLAWRHGIDAARDVARHAHATGRLGDDAFAVALDALHGWTPPVFPLTGKDAIAAGVAPGPAVGQILRRVQDRWIAGDFRPATREELLALLKRMLEEPEA